MSSVFEDTNLLISIGTATVSFLTILLYYHYNRTYSYWEKKGIKGPRPVPLIGNLWNLFGSNRKRNEVEWAIKYGDVYGIYQGGKPTLVVADPEVIIQICVKDFDKFPNHINTTDFMLKNFKLFIFNAMDEQWKRIRTLLSPTFTSGKMKRMFKLLSDCADDAVNCANEQTLEGNKEGQRKVNLNLSDLFNLYAMDGITRSCYGIKLERAGSKDLEAAASRSEFISDALQVFTFSKMRIILKFTLPKFLLKSFNFAVFPEHVYQNLVNRARGIIRHRRQAETKHDDYLQLLIDAKLEDKLELNELDLEENHHAGLTAESLQEDQRKLAVGVSSKGNQLTEDEIISHATILMAVGLETTSSLLTSCLYALAFHSEIQEKLYSELSEISIKRKDSVLVDFEYDSLTSCRYLDAVISETLRLFAPIIAIPRQAKQDYHLEKYNLDLPKDMLVFLAVNAVHENPKYWKNPKKFDPERFMPIHKDKIIPGSYLPFGLGPRHCLGMRFSLTETKIGMAKLLSAFRVEPAPGTKYPPKSRSRFRLTNIVNPKVQLICRN